MKIGLAQINSTLGDFEGNGDKILKYCESAASSGVDLVIFPELAIFGYQPCDLLERDSVVKAQLKALKQVQSKIPKGLVAVVGAVMPNDKKGKGYLNAAVVLQKGKKPLVCAKELLPNYDIFDEYRHFERGDLTKNIVTVKGVRILLTICEDIWGWGSQWKGAIYPENPLKKVRAKKFDLVVNISASPFSKNHHAERVEVAKRTANLLKKPVIYTNLVGAQDEEIFDGGSFVCKPKRGVVFQAPFFEENLYVYSTDAKDTKAPKFTASEMLRQALVFGIRDFAHKTGHKKAHLGLSGGVDSALVLALACEALGNENVTAIALPGPFSTDLSFQVAERLCANLGCEFKVSSINASYEAAKESFANDFGIEGFSLVHENLQARLRGTFLMAWANEKRSLLLSTGNKSEYAAGYCTLYGDMCGGLAVIGDLLKNEVYSVAKEYNREGELIPDEILTRAPSAELRPNQKDQDSLPPYDDLDRAVVNLVERCKSPSNETEKWLLPKLYFSEFKRWQAPPILRVSGHAFGRGRRFPISNKALF